MPLLTLFILLPGLAFAATLHVSPGGDDTAAGSPERPLRTIRAALAKARPGDRILAAAGAYRETGLALPEKVSLTGSHDPSSWRRDPGARTSVLDGARRGRILTAATGARIEGFTLRHGLVRGHGGAILCQGSSPVIEGNRFVENATLAPENWKPAKLHEDALDGGAIACRDGCEARIEGNVFVRNFTETGRGGAIAAERARPTIANNVFLENDSGRADPMRSSDGGAVSLYDRAHAVFTGNLLIRNRALTHNDGGGLFVALWSAPRIERNVFTGNYADDDGGALFLGGQKHHYRTPLDPLPPASEFLIRVSRNVIAGNSNASLTGGALRITMETRAVFTDNILAHNTGANFQRSEIEIAHNTILDDARYAENKDGLKPPRIFANILRRGLILEGNPTVEARDNVEGNVPFLDDGVELRASAARYLPDVFQTEFTVPGPAAGLAGRVVQLANEWTIVAAASAGSVRVWGGASRHRALRVLPRYRTAPGASPAGARSE